MLNSKQQVWVVFSALLLLSIHGAAAQTITASLSGVISDETQAVAAGTPLGTPDLWFDPCAFELPLNGMLGNVGRTTARGQGVIQFDFGLSKRLTVTEDVGIQFRAEFFNVPNRANFAHPSASTLQSSGTYRGNSGNITRTVTTSRQVQTALKRIY